jgi:lysophospholipase L1-like esterase
MRRLIKDWLPELLALPLLPILLWQGRITRATVARLPEPTDQPCGLVEGRDQAGGPLSLLLIGESPVAGIGVSSHSQGIAAATARALQARYGRTITWRARGNNGATVADATRQLLPLVPAKHIDLVCVAFGVNDSTAFRRASTWRRDIGMLLDSLQTRVSPHHIVLSGVPPLAHFPALPWPLRAVLGLKARSLDRTLADIAAFRPGVTHAPFSVAMLDRALMASDGYHPSEAGCVMWAGNLANAIPFAGESPLASERACR